MAFDPADFMISASNLHVVLSGKPVLKSVSLEAAAGRLTAIVGPNGCGKTTTMKAIAGELPYDGTVLINGHDIRQLKPWELSLKRGVLPQSAAIAFPFTVREVVQMGLVVSAHSNPKRTQEITASALEAVDLAGFSGRFYQELSGGEQQRVQLARVLSQIWEPVAHGEPRFLLLDEPVSALDIRHQLAIMELARDFCLRGGGVIAVMHDLNLTAMFADHVVMLKNGHVQASGPPRQAFTDETLEAVFGCRLRVNAVPEGTIPFILPHMALA